MLRRSFLQNTALTFGALTLSQQKIFSSFFQQAWKITMLTDDIGIFTERGGTIVFLLSKKGIVVVDSQFPDTSKHLIDELKKKSEKPFSLLINTHHHGDHTAGNIAFKELVPHVLLAAHELEDLVDLVRADPGARLPAVPFRCPPHERGGLLVPDPRDAGNVVGRTPGDALHP